MSSIQLLREPGIRITNPTITDVMGLLDDVLCDELEPCVVLEYAFTNDGSACRVVELLIARINDPNTGKPTGWLVRHYLQGSKRAFVLLHDPAAEGGPFTLHELFGALVKVSPRCVVETDLIQRATAAFLKDGEMNPDLVWSEFNHCVKYQ